MTTVEVAPACAMDKDAVCRTADRRELCSFQPVFDPTAEVDANLCSFKPIFDPAAEVDANLCSFKPIFDPTDEVDANLCSFKPIFDPAAEVDANLCSFKPIFDKPPLVDEVEPFGPEGAEATRDGPVAAAPQGSQPDGDGWESSLAAAVEMWERGLMEQSRQLDAFFGVNTERPEPGERDDSS